MEVLERRAELTPDRTALLFGGARHTFGELWRGVNGAAGLLAQAGVARGGRVVIVSPNCWEFFLAYHGAQRLGAVAVPLFHQSPRERVLGVVEHCGASAVVHGGDLEGCPVPALALGAFATAAASDLAMLQYTSGTTGASKGVMLTHANLLANVRQMVPTARFTERDVFVSWLPVYHDMGLITMTMCPLYVGAPLVLLPISVDPRRWLGAIAEHRGTMTAAPDFAYRYALKFIRDPSAYDLSSLRVALIAAEPVRASTVRRFEEAFGLSGVVKPGYGLAEASVAVAFWDLHAASIRVDSRGAVAIGPALPGFDLAIVGDDGEVAGPCTAGSVVMRGPSCTSGYYRDPQATRALHWRDGYLHTGDLGYLDPDGVLTLTGRRKELIIRGGRNYSPREIEEVVDRDPRVVCAAAVGLDAGDFEGEQVHVFAEVSRRHADPGTVAELPRQARQRLHEALRFRPTEVHLVQPRTIPRTHNGKIRYEHLRAMLREGQIDARVYRG